MKQSSHLKYTLVGLDFIYSVNCDCITCRIEWVGIIVCFVYWWGSKVHHPLFAQGYVCLFGFSSNFPLPSLYVHMHTHTHTHTDRQTHTHTHTHTHTLLCSYCTTCSLLVSVDLHLHLTLPGTQISCDLSLGI